MLTFIWILSNRHSVIILVLGPSWLRHFANQSESRKEWTSDLKPHFYVFFFKKSWYKRSILVHVSLQCLWGDSLPKVLFCSYRPIEMGHILNNVYKPHMQMFCRHPKSLSQEPSAEYTYWMKHLSLTRLKIPKNQCNNSTKWRMSERNSHTWFTFLHLQWIPPPPTAKKNLCLQVTGYYKVAVSATL